MKYNKYKNICSGDLSTLDVKINNFISKGCKPIGGVSVVVGTSNIIYVQTITVDLEYHDNQHADNDSKNILGEYKSEPEYLTEVRELAVSQKLAAVKLLIDKSGMSLKEAKDWVDTNC